MAITSEGTVPFGGYRTWYRIVGELPASTDKLPLLVLRTRALRDYYTGSE